MWRGSKYKFGLRWDWAWHEGVKGVRNNCPMIHWRWRRFRNLAQMIIDVAAGEEPSAGLASRTPAENHWRYEEVLPMLHGNFARLGAFAVIIEFCI